MAFFKDLVSADILTDWKPLIDSGKYYVDLKDGKVYETAATQREQLAAAISPDAPWVFQTRHAKLHCLWNRDIVKTFNFIPKQCRNCWKVVVKPRTVNELFLLERMQRGMIDQNPECACKCGIDLRRHTPMPYAGFFYNQGFDNGVQRYKEVRMFVNEFISPDVDVSLKKGCTEDELQFGPSDKYELPKDAIRIEMLIDEFFVMIPCSHTQPGNVRQKIMRDWIVFAWSIGDPTASICFNDGEPLVAPSVTYHEDIEM